MKNFETLIGWNGLPDWAMYITTDKNGRVIAHANKPIAGIAGWHSDGHSEDGSYPDWENTLQTRPVVEELEYRHECLKQMWSDSMNYKNDTDADGDIDRFIQDEQLHS